MNDFTQLEQELKKLRPAAPRADFLARVESALANDRSSLPDNVIVAARFRVNWLGLGLGLAAAATLLIMARVEQHPPQPASKQIASSNVPTSTFAAVPNFQPAGVTQVVYHQEDEGLVFPAGWQTPARRIRTAKQETMRWRDPQTGASIRVSYPAEEITLTPIAGQ